MENGKTRICLQTAAMLRKNCIQFKRNIAVLLLCLLIPIGLVAFLVFTRHEALNLPPLPLSLNMTRKTSILTHEDIKFPYDWYKKPDFGTNDDRKDQNVKSDERINDTIWLKRYKEETENRPDRELLGAVNHLDKQNGNITRNMEIFYSNPGYHTVAALFHHEFKRYFKIKPMIINWPLPFSGHNREHLPRNLRMAIALGLAMAVLSSLFVIPHIRVSFNHS